MWSRWMAVRRCHKLGSISSLMNCGLKRTFGGQPKRLTATISISRQKRGRRSIFLLICIPFRQDLSKKRVVGSVGLHLVVFTRVIYRPDARPPYNVLLTPCAKMTHAERVTRVVCVMTRHGRLEVYNGGLGS